MTTWKKTTEARYWEMLEILPPAAQSLYGFLVGEPWDHRACTVTKSVEPVARFQAFVEVGGKFYENTTPMTIAEFKAFTPSHIKEAA